MNTSPNWITNYQRRIEKNRRSFSEKTERPFVTIDARRKFTTTGSPRKFQGMSVVYFLSPETELVKRLNSHKIQCNESFQAAGIISKFVFLPIATYHITIVGIATNQSISMQEEIIKRVKDCFKHFRREMLQPPSIIVRGDISPDGSTLIAPIEPKDKKSLDTLYYIRHEIRKSLHPLGNDIVRNTPHNFHGHITLAYIVNKLSMEEYAKVKAILQRYERDSIIGKSMINTISLHMFETIVDWSVPIANLTFGSDEK